MSNSHLATKIFIFLNIYFSAHLRKSAGDILTRFGMEGYKVYNLHGRALGSCGSIAMVLVAN